MWIHLLALDLISGASGASQQQAQVTAGGKGKRRRCVVEIDGQLHFVSGEAEAIALIDSFRKEVVEEVREQKRVTVIRGKPVARKARVRVVSGSNELKHHAAYVTQEANRYIDTVYETLLREAMELDDEEVLLLS